MSDPKKRRTSLKVNLARNGFVFDGMVGKLGELTVTLEPTGWKLALGDKEIGKGAYSETQMKDIKAAAKEKGSEFGSAGKGAAKPLTEEQKKQRQDYNKTRSALKKFQKFIAEQGFTLGTDGYVLEGKKDVLLVLGKDTYAITKGKKEKATGTYADVDYNTFMDAVNKL